MRLVLAGMDHYRGTHAGLPALWLRGEAHDVPGEVAAYLGATFPGVFVEAPIVAESMDAPAADRAMRSPPKRRG